MTHGLSATIAQSRSLLQLTSSARKPCLYHHVTCPPSALSLPLLHNPPSHAPPFSTSTPRLKRTSTKHNSRENLNAETPSSSFFSSNKNVSNGSSSSSSNPAEKFPPAPDLLDFSSLDVAHERLVTKLKDDLVKLKPGGINVEAVEAVKVHFKPMSQTWAGRKLGKDIRDRQEKKEKGTTVRVGDLAQVLVRGRVCVLMVGEKEHVKPVLSSLQHSLTLPAPPTSSPDTPLEIHIPIPPTTGDSRAEAQLAAKKLGDKTMEKWGEARSAERKRLRTIDIHHGAYRTSKDGVWRGDLKLAKAHEKVVAQVTALVENTRRRLAGV